MMFDCMPPHTHIHLGILLKKKKRKKKEKKKKEIMLTLEIKICHTCMEKEEKNIGKIITIKENICLII